LSARLWTTVLGLLPALLIAGCAGGARETPDPLATGLVIEGMVIRNELPYAVTGVMIEVPATGAFAGCGNILPRSECSTTFEAVDHRRNPLLIRWMEHGQPQRTGEFVVEPPADARPGDTYLLEVVVFAPGQAGASLEKP
jgi:hypothetical protein